MPVAAFFAEDRRYMEETRVFVEQSDRRIDPFGDPIGETLILNKPLHLWQTQAFCDARLTPCESLRPPCLVVPDTLFASGGALRAFVDGAAGQDAVLVLKRSAFGKMTTPVQPQVRETEEGYLFEAIRFVSGKSTTARSVVVDPQEKVLQIQLPRQYIGEDQVSIGLPRHPVMTLHHWVHILWANQIASGYVARATPTWKGILKVLWSVLRAGSLNKWKILRKFSSQGKKCDIHPTALVEGSILGDGVSVGPYARVLFSTVGDGVSIMGGAQVEFSVLGERSVVSQLSVLRFSVLYPEAMASQYLMQQSVLGRSAMTTGGAFTIDLNFEKPIQVPLDGKLHSTGQRFLGSAFGHRCRIGTGFYLASGRTVPNDYFLIRNPARVLTKLPPGLANAGPLLADERVLRPLRNDKTEKTE